jgi:tetratricopeptide (TPR) repeat protein
MAVDPPDPGQANTLDQLIERLQLLKAWAGNPSYEHLKNRINQARTAAGWPDSELAGKTTIVDCFRLGRRRLNTDLVLDVVQALHPDVGYVTQWRQALRVVGTETRAASQVRVQGNLPPALAGFTGRAAELDAIRRACDPHQTGPVAVTLDGMAGVGKSQLAIHAAHLIAGERFDRVLFVNLRGFHPDAAQPPADPDAVLDGFLRLLGLTGQQIPHDGAARRAAYRALLADRRVLVLLDNAADEAQVAPLLPDAPGCVALVTSRRRLTGLAAATQLTVGVFQPDEALDFLARAAPDSRVGTDPAAARRIADQCGHLPLALGLVAAHITGKPDWTLTDHADRLDERHQDRRLDSGVELALDLSYRQLPADQQRLLRLLALHPGHDLDPYAAAALAGTDLATARGQVRRLCRDHLLQRHAPQRYTFHDLVRAYASGRGGDEDRPPARRAALTRLFDYYLHVAAAAMGRLYPAETDRRPPVTPVASPVPDLSDADSARDWLNIERPTLVAVAEHAATHGWPGHATRLSGTLYRYLAGGHFTDALSIHDAARAAAREAGDPAGEAVASLGLGATTMQLGQFDAAAAHFGHALRLCEQTGDLRGQARAVNNLGDIDTKLGRYRAAADRITRALGLYRRIGDRTAEARALTKLAIVEERLGQYEAAADHQEEALVLTRKSGDRVDEADVLNGLGDVEVRLGRFERAEEHLRQALALCRELGVRAGEAWALDSTGILYTRMGRPEPAAEQHRRALTIFRDVGDSYGETWALNGLGEAAVAGGRAAEAVTHHTASLTRADQSKARDQQARALAGLGRAHETLGETGEARRRYTEAVDLYGELGAPEADELRARLAGL